MRPEALRKGDAVTWTAILRSASHCMATTCRGLFVERIDLDHALISVGKGRVLVVHVNRLKPDNRRPA